MPLDHAPGSPRRRAPVAVALALALLAAACGAPILQVDTGVPLVDADLAMSWTKAENRKSDDFSEQLVVRGTLPDGATLYAKLTVTNLASADGRADLSVAVTLPDGRKLKFREKKDREDWTFATDRFYAEVGDGSLELGVGHAKVVCKNDDFELEAEIASTLPPLRPAGGLVKAAAGYYVTTIPIPRGRLTMKLTLLTDVPPEEEDDRPPREEKEPEPPPAGTPEVAPPAGTPESAPLTGTPEAAPVVAATETQVADADPVEALPDPEPPEPPELPRVYELEGVGYAEHRASTIAPYALAHRWHGIVDVGEERTVVFSAFEHAHERDARAPTRGVNADPIVQGWVLAASDDGFIVYEPELRVWVKDWQTDGPTNYPTPGLVFLSDPERQTFEAVIKPSTLTERKDDLGGLKKIERLVVKRFMKPWTFRFDHARFLMRSQPAGQPMTEVRGEARYQYQQLNP